MINMATINFMKKQMNSDSNQNMQTRSAYTHRSLLISSGPNPGSRLHNQVRVGG